MLERILSFVRNKNKCWSWIILNHLLKIYSSTMILFKEKPDSLDVWYWRDRKQITEK